MIYFWQRLSFMAPKTLVYFCAIRLIAHATSGKHGRDVGISGMDAVKIWMDDYAIE